MFYAKDFFEEGDEEHIVEMRRYLHQIPELELDLPETTAYVTAELQKLGIPCTGKYAPSSVVGYLNYGVSDPSAAPAVGEAGHVYTIALRADMDALPVEEKTGLSFSSKYPGKMHACGHDAHTAMLLGAAGALKRAESSGALSCRVKLIFQPNEEGATDGAPILVSNGVLDDVDYIVGQHIEMRLSTGQIGWHSGEYMAACHCYEIRFHGKSSHATRPENGNDALCMAVKACNNIYLMNSREIAPFDSHIVSVGALHAGTVHNVIADSALMKISVRYFYQETNDLIDRRIRQICRNAADELSGTVDIQDNISAYVVYNDPGLTEKMVRAAEKVVPEGNVKEIGKMMGSEDFSAYLTRRPGVFLRLGTGNPAKGCVGAPHNNDIILDEDAFLTGSMLLCQIALDEQGY